MLATFGLLVAHAAVNIFNDYFDARSGLDYKTRRTPFSGGSGAAPEGLLTVSEVFLAGNYLLTHPDSDRFIFCTEIWLDAFTAFGAGRYSDNLLYPFHPENGVPRVVGRPGAGDSAGDGRLFCSYRRIFSEFLHRFHAFFFLVHNLLLLNEFPDAQADVTVGRQDAADYCRKEKKRLIFSLSLLCWFMSGWSGRLFMITCRCSRFCRF